MPYVLIRSSFKQLGLCPEARRVLLCWMREDKELRIEQQELVVLQAIPKKYEQAVMRRPEPPAGEIYGLLKHFTLNVPKFHRLNLTQMLQVAHWVSVFPERVQLLFVPEAVLPVNDAWTPKPTGRSSSPSPPASPRSSMSAATNMVLLKKMTATKS